VRSPKVTVPGVSFAGRVEVIGSHVNRICQFSSPSERIQAPESSCHSSVTR
jgi:hypothetical protein